MRARDLNWCIDRHRPRQISALPASRSCPATPSTILLNRVGCPRAPHLQRSNPHRARCTTACQFPRFLPWRFSYAGPLGRWRHRHGPASENLHRSGREQMQQSLYSITSSARTKTDGGTVSPSDFAVLIFTDSSSLVGNSTGSSVGFEPLSTLATIPPVCRQTPARLGP
jgi:hypothetical protein